MNRKRLLVPLIGALFFGGMRSPLVGQTPSLSVEQQLRSQYRIASVGSNGVVVRAGTVLALQQDGIKADPASCQDYYPNSYKKGSRVRQPALIINTGGNLQNCLDQLRLLQVGEKAYLTALDFKASDIVFRLQTISADANDVPYRATVTFKFQKGSLEPTELKQVQETIGEVFAFDTSGATEGAVETQQQQGPQQPPLSGLYFMQQTGAHLQLSSDGSFSLLAANGQVSPGHYSVTGDSLSLTYQATGQSSVFRIQGGMFYSDFSGLAWVRQGDLPVPAGPVQSQLRLPATYANSQTPADQLQLKANNTLSLQEAGQPYNGTFQVNGNTMKIHIDPDTDTTATVDGNKITDASGQTWVLKEQSAAPAAAEGALRNQDIIQLVKAGLDDATVLAKIASSKCQFDTQVDALIQLKNSGVSAAVIKAMVGAAR